MPVFVCPRCAYRETASDRRVRHQPRGCGRCGFGFSFEMLEDFYAGPRCALVVADAQRRVLVAGHGAFAATGYQEQELIGREIVDALGLDFGDEDPVAVSLEWGVRKMGVPCAFRPKGATGPVAARCDIFPAYDEDGGLMLALTPD